MFAEVVLQLRAAVRAVALINSTITVARCKLVDGGALHNVFEVQAKYASIEGKTGLYWCVIVRGIQISCVHVTWNTLRDALCH